MHLFSDNTALRSHVEAQANFLHALSRNAVDLLCQVGELNLKLARQEVKGALYAGRDILACSDPMHMLQAAMRQVAPAAGRLLTDQQHLLSVLAGGQGEPGGAAEARLPAASRSASAVGNEVPQRAAASAPGETHH